MKIKFEGEYKSLSSFESDDLEKFTLITGKNGCGKSQLLELIKTTTSNTNKSKAPALTLRPNMRKVQFEGIITGNMSPVNNQNWVRKVNTHINKFNLLKENSKKLIDIFINANIPISIVTPNNALSPLINEQVINTEDLRNTLEESLIEFGTNLKHRQVTILDLTKVVLPHLRKFTTLIEVGMFVSEQRKTSFINLSELDFLKSPIPEYLLDDTNLFGSELEFVFYNYAKRRDTNRKLFFYKKEDGEHNGSIPDKEFVAKFIPPWSLINNILKEHDIDFKFEGIKKTDFSSDINISFKLIKVSNDKVIELNNLSSGEKIILGLIIKLFTSIYYEEKLELPELIILDEPDAHLHPEMSKLLIDVLYKTFVNKLGIRVIMVTHSPSTVALCPDNSIYQLQNEPITNLKKIEKGEALEILTGNLPTLSIDYNSHKQVFVESPTDIKYYQMIFDKLNQEKKYPYKLYFMSNDYGKGNCEQVKKIVKDIRFSGNTTSYGIIDWDLKNKSSTFVKVHGENNRYSIENYLCDPIYIAILLMTLEAHNIHGELDLDKTTNQYSIGELDNASLQKIVDWFFKKYYEIHTTEGIDKATIIELEYLNGRKVEIPKWFAQFKGHDVETRIKKMFPALEGKFRSEGDMQKEICKIVGKCYPFIPMDSVKVIESLVT